MSDYDLIVIGAGSGGYVTAVRAAQLGASVAVIEEDKPGGTCLNHGCIPTKTMVASARLVDDIKRSEEFGIKVDDFTIDFNKIIQRKSRIVEELVDGVHFLFKKNNIELIKGSAKLLSNKVIEVTNEGKNAEFSADSIVIATGSKPFILPEFNYDGRNVVSSREALEFTSIPEKLVIIGAGYIGCEFASIYSSLGSKVTIIEVMKQILPGEERSTASRMERVFLDRGITINTDTRVEQVELIADDNVVVHLSSGESIAADRILAAVGRIPRSQDIGLERIGIRTDERGFIEVDDKMETSVPGIYAVGDVTGRVMLAHVASAQGITAAENIMGKDIKMDYSSIPAVIFTNPEMARVGLSYSQARKAGFKVKIGRFPYRANGKAKAIGEDNGIVTLICEQGTDRILGGEIFGAEASNLIAEITLAVKNGITTEELASTIHAHPTLAEMVMEAAEDINGLSIHS